VTILPGATIGILGNGQLGRMTALAARALGYHVAVDPPDRSAPAGQVADRRLDEAAALTFEFENVQRFETGAMVRPSFDVLHITQNRLREKTWLREHGFPIAPFAAIHTAADLEVAPYPGVLKTAGFGYDGKGQSFVASVDEAKAKWDGSLCVLEGWIAFQREVSVVAARGPDGSFAHFGVIENRHRNHILDVSKAPVTGAEEAIGIARRVLEELDVVGLLCVEFFQLAGGTLLINELAPRPHNSGHLTIEACYTSQFEQHVRAVCGLPLGDSSYRSAAAMANLLGDEWMAGEPDWAAALSDPRVKLHLYGKAEPRPGRKMGHLTALAATPDEAAQIVLAARRQLH
jgi:5-(carboxyamino)imidazole ribonucleotide synthase